VYGPLGIFDYGDETRELTEPPFGNNMAYRKELFLKYGYFRTELGPRPGSEIRSEDTEFGERLLSAGERIRYEPSAVLFHTVPANRIQKSYLLAWWFAKARANVREFGIRNDTKWIVAGIPVYLFRRLGMWTFRWFFSVGSSRRFFNKRQVWGVAGEITEYFFQSGAQRDSPAQIGS
jgi:GT2 family glycosyltransferase